MSSQEASPSSSVVYDGRSPLAPLCAHLGIPRNRPVLIVVGWADAQIGDKEADDIDLLLRRVVVPVCRDENVIIVTGGTNAGVMAALGSAVAELAPGLVLVGVAPDSLLTGSPQQSPPGTIDPEPSHVMIRTPGTHWGAEAPALVRLAELIAGSHDVTVLAIGGGAGTCREVVLAARRHWPVILSTGGGGLSDQLARILNIASVGQPARKADSQRPPEEALSSDLGEPERRELVAARDAGRYLSIDMNERAGLERALRWRVSNLDLLKDAWARFAVADALAVARKKPTSAMIFGVIVLAVSTVAVGIIAAWLGRAVNTTTDGMNAAAIAFKGATTALPLAAVVLLGLIDRRSKAGSWIGLRASAEAIIREIYRCRARLEVSSGDTESALEQLADALDEIHSGSEGWTLMRRRPSVTEEIWPPVALWQRVPLADSLLGSVTGKAYDAARVRNQVEFYEDNALKDDRRATRTAALIFVVAAVAAFLLALSWGWPSLTAGAAIAASVGAAMISWREYKRRDASVRDMLHTAVAIRSARNKWLRLPSNTRAEPQAVYDFVMNVEEATATEGLDWERRLKEAHRSFLDRQKGR